MATFARQLIALDMLSQDMQDELDDNMSSPFAVPDDYLRHLTRYQALLENVQFLAEELTENGFSDAVHSSGLCRHISTKRMVEVQAKLLKYVLDFYDARYKADQIQDSDFGEHADKRLGLLQTKAIKARGQFKTVAKALGVEEYQAMVESVPLPHQDWEWQKLGLED